MITSERLKELLGQKIYYRYIDEYKISEITVDQYYIDSCYWFNELYETEEDAKFALRFKRIPKTEFLDLPTWEEIEDVYDLEFGNSIFEVYKTKNRISVKANKDCYYDYTFNSPATKENYLLACESCRKLWLGE